MKSEQLTVKEAIQQGYGYCFIIGTDWKELKELSDLTDDEFDHELVLAEKEPSYPLVPSNEDLLGLLAEHIISKHIETTGRTADIGEIEDEIKKIDLGDLHEKLSNAASIGCYYKSTVIRLVKDENREPT